ncbi:inositol monophosphatase [Candidatus Woesearchaeota archaeon]|nr:inositol monophosphatase [Candidatus Woesearchaeota archaeon]
MEPTIKTALKEAGKILMENFGKLDSYDIKENQSNIVTKADIDSEMAIIRIIEKKFPDHNIIAEETGFRDKNSNFTWIIDPLDGTSNFSAGIPWFGILICVLKDSKPVMAGIYLPFYDLLYFAEAGKGATKNAEKISVSKESDLKNVLMTYSLDYCEDISKTEKESKIITKIVNNIRNLRATNCVVDFCYTADGRLGGCINQTTKIWDIVAPYLIIKESGGIITDIDGKDIKFDVNKETYQKNFTIVGSNKMLHSKIMNLIKEIAP